MHASKSMVLGLLQFFSFRHILADVKTSPKRTMKLKGDTAVLRCISTSSIPDYPIQWTHRKVGAPVSESSFVYFEGQLYESYDHGRHSVIVNDSLKTYDLVIKNLSLGDAGTYTCAHVLESSEYSDIELAILESLPRCSSNISLANVLVDNDCGLTPDYMDLICQIGYRGSIAPVLQWRHSAEPYVIISTSKSQPQAESVTSLSHPLKPYIEINGTYYICSVDGFGLDNRVVCKTPHIGIAYIFKPSAISDNSDTAVCIANTSSQDCVYTWNGTYVPSDGSVEWSGQTLKWDEHFNDIRCKTDCNIKGVRCTVTSEVLSGKILKNKSQSDNGMIVGLVGIPLSVIVAIIVTILVIRKINSRHRESASSIQEQSGSEHQGQPPIGSENGNRMQRSGLENDHQSQQQPGSEIEHLMPHQNGSESEHQSQPQKGFENEFLISPVPQKAFDEFDPTSERYSTLVGCLDAVNGLADHVYSKGLLKEDECQQLTNMSSYEKQAEELLKKLEPRMKTEQHKRKFLDALIESDQRHVYNFIIHSRDNSDRILDQKERERLKNNHPCLLSKIKSTDRFLDQLVEHRCITDRHNLQIKQHQNMIERNRELLAIMKRRSAAHFKAFKCVLQKKGQNDVVQMLQDKSDESPQVHYKGNRNNHTRIYMGFAYLVAIILHFGNLHLISAEVKTSPKELIKVEGDTAILHCVSSSNPAGPLQWKYLKLGTSAQEAEYVFFDGQFFEPYDGERHSVVFKDSPKTLDLNITKLSLEDAGTYICSNVLNTTDYSDIELTILESPPRCRTNISLNNLLVDNDCNLTPDYFELNCSVGYRSKVAPVLLWSHSAQPDIVLSTSNSQPQSNKVTSLTHHIKPVYDMNGTHFICTIEGMDMDQEHSACATQNITIEYIFHPEATTGVNRATCIANTSSERCVYRWQGRLSTSNITFEFDDRILRLEERMNNVSCVTECEIHGQKCVATSQVLPELSVDVENDYSVLGINVLIFGVWTILFLQIYVMLRRYGTLFLPKFWMAVRGLCTKNVRVKTQQKELLSHQDVSDNFIQEHFSTLTTCLDAVNGLPDELYSRGMLTEKECHQLGDVSSYESQARTLLKMLVPRMESESQRKTFLDVLIDTDQEHVCEYLIHFKDTGRNTSNRILNKCELNCIQRNYPHLLNLINSKNSFLDGLFKNQCITERQLDRIKQQPDKIRRNRELLAIMKRRSFAHFEAFKTVLTKTKQRNLVQMLNDMKGSVISLHCTISMENQSEEAITEFEQRICDSINDPQHMSHGDQLDISMQLRSLTDIGIELIGASPTGSIHLYFLCKTLEAVTFLKKTYDSGDIRQLLESVLNIIRTNPLIPSTLEIVFDQAEYQRTIGEIRENMYYSRAMKKIIRPPFILLPEEMLKLILQKSFVRSWSNALKSYAPKDIETGGYALFQKFVSSEGKVVYINLKSVMFKWKDTCSMQGLLRLAIIKRLRDCKDTLVQRLNCQYGLLDSLKNVGVINYEEENEILDESTESKDRFLPSYMPASNERLIKCISEKSFKEINAFLKQMDAMKLGHLLNFMFCSEKLRAFDESWPLDDVTRNCIEHIANKLPRMNILITAKTIGYVSATHPGETLPRGVTLLDILCYQSCISSKHKRYIQEQPTDEFRNAALFQMLVSGSIKTYKTTVAYLRDTEQYVELVQHILVPGGKEITKVAWLENKIYVACYKSSIIYVFSDEEPFVRLEEEEIDIPGILLPYDIAACSQNRIIYISDRVNKILWRIQLAEGDQRPQLLKRSVAGEPIDLFVMSSGDLLLTVEHETQRRLEIYSPEDFNRPKTILISKDVHHAWHAVQLSTGTFVVASRSIDTIRVGRAYFLQEISADGEVLRKFESIYENESITPFHLSVDTKDNILFGDALKKAVYVVDSEWRELEILLTEKEHGVKEPERLCFVPEKNLLVIGNRSSVVSIFNL